MIHRYITGLFSILDTRIRKILSAIELTKLLLFSILIMLWGCAHKQTNIELHSLPVETQHIDVPEFDSSRQIVDPLSFTLSAIPSLEGTRRAVEIKFDRAESPSSAVVTVVDDGYLDDSIRGGLYQFTFKSMNTNYWRLIDTAHAWRCWRSNVEEFGTDKCL